MKNYKWLVIFIIFVFVAIGFFLKSSNVSLVKNFQKEQVTENKNENQAEDSNKAPVISINGHDFVVEVAIDPAVQKKGLSGRESLPENAGIIFAYPGKNKLTFWMIDMRFNIDLLWINDDKIVGIEKNMLAPAAGTEDKDLVLYSSPEPVNRVLEINSGLVDKYGLKVGDTLEYNNINF